MIDSVNELYHLNLKLKILGKTINVPEYIPIYENIIKVINDDDELMVLQYVYSLKNTTKKNSSKNNNYKDYFKILDTMIAEKLNLELEVKNLRENNQVLTNNLKQAIEINKKIIESKSWKITEPLRKITNKIKKK